MTDRTDLLAQISAALEERVTAGSDAVAALRFSKGHAISAQFFEPDLVVTSEQSLPRESKIEVLKGRDRVAATIAGRDPQTNVALLRLDRGLGAARPVAAEPRIGQLVFAFGGANDGSPSVRTGVVRRVGPEWFSQAGGRISSLILLDVRLSAREEGGPVFNAAGGWLGMSTFGPRGEVLVIPAATIERIVAQLLAGGIKRGWLGAKLQRVAIPDALAEAARQRSGLMIMSIAENAPANSAGLLPGDVILSIDGASTRSFRNIAARFGAESIGRSTEIKVIRGGAVQPVQVTIQERPKDA